MIKVIYFDFFNVISTPPYTPVILKYLPEKLQKIFIGKLTSLDLGDVTESELQSQIAKEAQIEKSEIEKEITSGPRIDRALIKCIKTLKPKFKIGLLTNSTRSCIERILKDEINLFDIVIISSDVRIIKPNREIYELAIQKADAAPDEILFFDDGVHNIDAAKEVGIKGVVYTNFENFIKDIKQYVD